MAYHTGLYLILFLPLAVILYYLLPKKMRWCVLLCASYVFIFISSRGLIVYLLITTVFTHYTGLRLAYEKRMKKEQGKELAVRYKKKERRIVTLGILLLIGMLLYFQYYNFFVLNLNALLPRMGISHTFMIRELIFPIGISFYTLQAISYMLDVYWGKVTAEDNLAKMALFLAFFPQIMEGPICRYEETADQLWEGQAYDYHNISQGFLRIVWGLLKKIVIADRLNTAVNQIFDHYENYSGIAIAVAAIGYTIQLYAEFSGSIDMVIGSARLFGITLPENFRQPFFAGNAAEFWQRWHMSLGKWFRDYIFYPVSVSRPVKKWNRYGRKNLNKYWTKLGVSAMALLPVWLCTGFWHGPRWSYIFYGFYYFTIIMFGIVVEPLRRKVMDALHVGKENLVWNTLRIGKTWLIIFTGELFFRAEGLKQGIAMFRSMFHDFHFAGLWSELLLKLGLDRADYFIILVGYMVVMAVDIIREKKVAPLVNIQEWKMPYRFILYQVLLFAVIIFGAYGTGYNTVDLIYAGF